MDPPLVEYNVQMYNYIKEMRKDRHSYMLCDLDVLGEGAAGTTYTAYVKPKSDYPNPVVLKEQKRTRFCANEFEALKLIRELMIAGELPGYYIFMYGCFVSGSQKYLILEKADKSLDSFLTDNNVNTRTFMYIFYHVAKAVSLLEKLEFNHGDLWVENVMLKWTDPCESDNDNIPEGERKFIIKLIDYDSAYMTNSQIKNPSYGGADIFRKKFIIGYDLNRFFDSLIYAYESYIEKKTEHKQEKINRAKKLLKKGKKVVVPKEDEQDTDDEEFDADNIIYPPEVIDFMYQLGPSEPNVFDQCPDMSGESVIDLILKTLQIQEFH